MKMIHWSPIEEMTLLQDQINKIFEPSPVSESPKTLNYTFPVEVTETPARYLVRLMAPGIDPDKIELQATPKGLTVKAEFQSRKLESDETLVVNQFRYGQCSQSLAFSEDIHPENVEAQYKNGILEVSLPKTEHIHRKSIQIKVAE